MKTSRKIRSLLSLSATAALLLAMIGSAVVSVAAQDANVSQQQDACVVFGTAQMDEMTAEATQTVDTDQIESQDQTGEDPNAPEIDQVQDPSYSGSIAVDEAAMSSLSGTALCDTLSKLATITPDQAKAAVEQTGGVVDSIELNVENGSLVYSVQLQDGSDVKVDAGSGSILNTQTAGSDNEIQGSENGAEVD